MEINGFKLTQKAQLAIRFAQESSVEYGGIVGTEHLLTGLVREGSGIAAKTLATRGVTADSLGNVMSKFFGDTHGGYKTRIEFTPRTKNVLELSVREAQRMTHRNKIGGPLCAHYSGSLRYSENITFLYFFSEHSIHHISAYADGSLRDCGSFCYVFI